MRLRQIKDSDAHQIASLLNNKRIWDNLRDIIPFPYKVKDAKEFIEHCQTEAPQLTFAIELNDELVGVIGLVLQTDIYSKSAEIGYWLGEPYWGKGIMSKAVEASVNYGFNEIGLVRIYTGVFEYNKPSQRVLEKAGFRLEGVFEKAVNKNEKILDEYRYAIINDSWDQMNN